MDSNTTESEINGIDPVFEEAAIESLLPMLTRIAERSLDRRWQAKLAASDLVQQTVLEAIVARPHFKGKTLAEFNRWLRSILQNNVIDTRRQFVDSQKRTVDQEESIDQQSQPLASCDKRPSSIVRRRELNQAIGAAMDSLPSADRNISVLRHQQRLTFAEIGDIVGLSEDATRKRWKRILGSLKVKLLDFDVRPVP